jgi:acetylornithine deacetylase/succinyl-diaminopimelate desuccinylase-like protein
VVEVWRGEAVRLLQNFVRVPSVMEEEGAVQEVVERAFRERGFAVDKREATAAEKLKSRTFKAAC